MSQIALKPLNILCLLCAVLGEILDEWMVLPRSQKLYPTLARGYLKDPSRSLRFLICMNSFVVCSNYLHEKSHFHIPHKNICLPLNDCSDGFCNQNSCRILYYKYHRCDLQLSRGFSLCEIPVDSFCQISARTVHSQKDDLFHCVQKNAF